MGDLKDKDLLVLLVSESNSPLFLMGTSTDSFALEHTPGVEIEADSGSGTVITTSIGFSVVVVVGSNSSTGARQRGQVE